jgi:electron transfer flavoprotein alpha subunit
LSTLAILEQKDGKINIGSLGAVTAGQKLGGSIHGFVAGKAGKSVAQEAAKIQGLEKVVAVENEAYERGLPENWAPLLVENIKKGGYTHVIVSHSAFGKSLLPRVAALLDVQQLSDVMSIESEDSELGISQLVGVAVLTSHSSFRPTHIRGQRDPYRAEQRLYQTTNRTANIIPTSRNRGWFSVSGGGRRPQG